MNDLTEAGLPTWIRASGGARPVFEAGPCVRVFEGLRVAYPPVVIAALVALYREFNDTLGALVESHREWPTDYACCATSDQPLVNWIVQIDLTGLGDPLLEALGRRSGDEVRRALRQRVFEIENSWAAYRTHACASGTGRSNGYAALSARVLDGVRERHGRPIALVAETEAKARAMLHAELGRADGSVPDDDEVRALTGFDTFLGPETLARRLARGDDEHLLYVRASDPVEALREESVRPTVARPLLEDRAVRRRVRARALTTNVDAPHWSAHDPRRLNDTKLYLPRMDMGTLVEREEDLAAACERYGEVRLRLKPAQGSYGCYGHLSGRRSDKRFRYALRSGLRRWGRFVAQPERDPAVAVNERDGLEYEFMDRVFCGIVDDAPTFLGGQRIFLERTSTEARRRRLHIVGHTVFAEIAAAPGAGG